MTKKFSVPRGTTDILPGEISLWQEVESNARTILNLYGYTEIRTPIFEETELFARSMGQTSDIVQKQMLSLTNGLSLRPEGTASIVRSYIQHNLAREENLSKLFYIGPMFRGERPQKGRLRQFHQIGVEAIGPASSSPCLDAEVIALSVHILKSLGLKGFKLMINTLGSGKDKEAFSKYLRKQLQAEVSNFCDECQQRFKRNVFRILDCKKKACKTIVDQFDFGYDHLSEESRNYFLNVKEALDSLKIEYEQSPKLVRGLDYYTHTVFEICDSSLGSQDALGAGGRYGSLVAQLGGTDVDAIGFALGIERILLARSHKQTPAKFSLMAYIIALDEGSLKKAFEMLHALRQEKVVSDMSFRLSSLKSQMRVANKKGVCYVIILGEDEGRKGCVTLKDMETGKQEEVSVKGGNYKDLAKILLREG